MTTVCSPSPTWRRTIFPTSLSKVFVPSFPSFPIRKPSVSRPISVFLPMMRVIWWSIA